MSNKNQSLKSKSNFRNRTFTLRCYKNGVLIAKFRTKAFDAGQFADALDFSNEDWESFLANTGASDHFYEIPLKS